MANVYSIVAAVPVAAPKFLKAAFKNHEGHGRMGKGGEITAAGLTFFNTREGKDWSKSRADYEAAVKSQGYEFHTREGVEWPHKRGVNWQPGAGFIGKAAFFFALCQLTTAAAKAATKAKPAAETKAPAKAAAEPATTKPASSKAKAPTKAKPATVKATA